MSVAFSQAGNVFQIRQRVANAIIVEPTEDCRWVWRLYRWDGAALGTRNEYGSHDLVIDSAREYSQATGLPAFHRAAAGALPMPMRRGGRRTPR